MSIPDTRNMFSEGRYADVTSETSWNGCLGIRYSSVYRWYCEWKILMERMLPLVESLVELRDGHCRYRLREGIKPGKIVLVSTCGNWEMDNFDLLLVHMEAASKNVGKKFERPLLRPHAAF